MRVRPDPLILGMEFADEGGGTESHSNGHPGTPGFAFTPQLACQSDLPSPPPPTKSKKGQATT
jgi:hypothetical protein